MLEIFKRIIKGKSRILDDNLKKYGLYPYNVKSFRENIGYKELYFITTVGTTVVLKINRDSLDIVEFLKNSNKFIWAKDQYINISLVKSTRRFFAKRPFRLRIYFNDNTKIELSNEFQTYYLNHLNNEIRSLIKIK